MVKTIAFLIFGCSVLQGFYCFNCVPRKQSLNSNAKSDSKSDFFTAASNEDFPITLTRSAEALLKFFNQPENIAFEGVQELIRVYNQVKEKKEQYEREGKTRRHPFIVFEGLSGSGKTTVTAALAKKINGTYIHSPSKTVERLRNKFRNNTLLDNAYHHFAQFITALEVYVLLNTSPVIMDRYYYSSSSFYIGRLVYNNPEKYSLPPKGDKIYTWPEGLLKPDIVLFFDVDEDIRQHRLNTRPLEEGQVERKFGKNELLLQNCPDYRTITLDIYKHMEDPSITVINGNLSIDEVVKQCYLKVKPLLVN